MCFLCFPLVSEQKIASLQGRCRIGEWVDEGMRIAHKSHVGFSPHAARQVRCGWPRACLFLAFKGNGIDMIHMSHQLTQTWELNTQKKKNPHLRQCLFLDNTQPSQSEFPPAVFNLSFPLYLWPFHFSLPPYQSALPSCRLHFLSILPYYWPFSFILPPFLYLSSPPGLGCNSACFRAS